MFTIRKLLVFRVPVRLAFTSAVQALKEPKKFYKSVSVVGNANSLFEVSLDKRKLKTPLGNVFTLSSEGLALAVAQEWNDQKKTIKRDSMNLTALCNTVIDNPRNLTAKGIVDSCMNFLPTDAICYRSEEPPEFVKLQAQKWDPILKWVEDRFQVKVPTTTSLCPLEIDSKVSDAIRSYLNQFSLPALFALQQAVEGTKSLLLALALLNRAVGVVEAASLARLEPNYQTMRWGTVEWHHDIEHHDLVANLASAFLYFHCITEKKTC